MPLYKLQTIVQDTSCFGIWKIEESEVEAMHFSHELLATGNDIPHPRKRLEFIFSRHLVKVLCSYMDIPFTDIYKDTFGKPLLKGQATHISLAHSYPYVCAMVHLNAPCGIDIEQPSEKVMRVKHKFMSDDELLWADSMDFATLVWSAKETLYKIYARRKLIFREEMAVLPPESVPFDKLFAEIKLEGKTSNFLLGVEKVDDFWITYFLE